MKVRIFCEYTAMSVTERHSSYVENRGHGSASKGVYYLENRLKNDSCDFLRMHEDLLYFRLHGGLWQIESDVPKKVHRTR